MPYAHSRNGCGQRHDLVEHLRNVAARTKEFATALNSAEAGYWAGLWHDLGKFHQAFQRYLLACEEDARQQVQRVDHKAAGARLAMEYLPPLALLVHGHHGGLRTPIDLQTWLAERERIGPDAAKALRLAEAAMPDLRPSGSIPLPDHLHDPIRTELFLRLLFSALVDADYLDTERHFAGERAALRGSDVSIAHLWSRFEANQAELQARADTESPVNQARNAIYHTCLEAAEAPPGLFRLGVPTGGGKTRSVMAFALRHALRHGLQRVVVAVPFISITEQTAAVYRDIFESSEEVGSVVLEHHSSAALSAEPEEDFHAQSVWSRLAAENWDAPIVVTTTVQLFESLFASSPSATRKLHRLARSVIILDEAQALPTGLLAPILDVLRQLCRYYGATVVLSTATQPAFESIPAFTDLGAREIVPDAARFFETLKRVEYDWRTEPALSWTEIADLLRQESQALAVVNTKQDALALLDALEDPEALHLSTLLCGAHRRAVIAEVAQRLRAGTPCRLVSTQVVEAGVDLDFPLVLRAMGPLDSIVQSAGRCNREGKLPQPGRVIVVRPQEGGMPAGAYRTGANVTAALLGKGNLDINLPETARSYFRQLFRTVNLDEQGIQGLRARLDYPQVAHRFRMVDGPTESVVVTEYGTPKERDRVQQVLDRLRDGVPDARYLLRELQPYMVSVRSREAEQFKRRGLIMEVRPGLGQWYGGYHPVRGLLAHGPSAERLVC